MKFRFLFSLTLVTFWVVSCDAPKPTAEKPKQVTVGMTYDEVEKIFGKPSSLTRGVNQIKLREPKDWTAEELKDVVLPDTTLKDSLTQYWVTPTIETTGQLMYVTWAYSDMTDTVKCFMLKKKEISGKVPIKVRNYYSNGKKVTLEDYDWLVVAKRPNTKLEIKISIDSTMGIVRTDTVRTNYYIKRIFCIVFDASSGRVVTSNYCPYEIVLAR